MFGFGGFAFGPTFCPSSGLGYVQVLGYFLDDFDKQFGLRPLEHKRGQDPKNPAKIGCCGYEVKAFIKKVLRG